jgi:hypothetical protein
MKMPTTTMETELEQMAGEEGDLFYTDRERAIYRLIAAAGAPVKTTAVTEAIYPRAKNRNALITVGGMLNRLKYKLDRNGHPYRLAKSKQYGPHPIRWQLVRRPPSGGRASRARRSSGEPGRASGGRG